MNGKKRSQNDDEDDEDGGDVDDAFLLCFPFPHPTTTAPFPPSRGMAVYPGSPLLSSGPLPLALPSKAAGVPNKLVISELISTHDDASV